jgi:hypothetical protein
MAKLLNKDARLEIRLPQELKSKVQQYCRDNKCTVSEALTELLEQLVQDY